MEFGQQKKKEVLFRTSFFRSFDYALTGFAQDDIGLIN